MKVSLLLPSTLPALDQKFSVLLVVGVLLDLLDGMFSVNVGFGFGFDFDFDFALSAFIIFISEDPYKSSSSSSSSFSSSPWITASSLKSSLSCSMEVIQPSLGGGSCWFRGPPAASGVEGEPIGESLLLEVVREATNSSWALVICATHGVRFSLSTLMNRSCDCDCDVGGLCGGVGG